MPTPDGEQTVADVVRLAKNAGFPDDVIRSKWEETTGVPLAKTDPMTPISQIKKSIAIRANPPTIEDESTAYPEEKADIQRANPGSRKPFWQSAAEDVTVGALGLPMMALGGVVAASSMMRPMDDPFLGPGEPHPSVGRGFDETKKMIAERSERSGAEVVKEDAGDVAAGAHMLFDLATGRAIHGGEREPTFAGAVAKGLQGRVEQGAEMTGGMIGGTLAQAADPIGTARNMPVSTALNALPLAGPAAQGLRRVAESARATNFTRAAKAAEKAAEVAERASSPVEGVTQKVQDAPLHTDAAMADAAKLYKRVQDGEITIQQAAAIMDKLHPGRASVAYKALQGAAAGVDKAAAMAKWGGIGALAGDILPGGGIAGFVGGAALPVAADAIRKMIPPTARAAIGRRVADRYAQPTPEETARAREKVDESRNIAGGIVAATEVAGGRAQRGVTIDPNAAKAPVPTPGAVVRAVGEEGVTMPRNEAMAREGVSEVVGQEGRNIAREREVARVAREESARIIDPENPERAQAMRDKQFLEDRLQASDDRYAAMRNRNDEAWERHQNRRNYTMQKLQEKGAELALAEGEATAAYRAFAEKYKQAKADAAPGAKLPRPSNPRHPAHAEWQAMVQARAKRKALRNYVGKVKESRAEMAQVAERLWRDKEILRRRRAARARIVEGYNDDIAARFARERTALEQRIEGARLEGKKGLMHRLEEKLARLNEDEATRQSRPRVGLLDLRKKIRDLDTLRPAARRAKNLERDARRAAFGEPAQGTKPVQWGAAQRAQQLVRGSVEPGKPIDLPFTERELDEAAGLAKPGGTGQRSVTTLDPATGLPDKAFEGAIDDVHQLVNTGGRREIFTRDEVARWMTEGMHDQSLTLMSDPGFRGLVEARLVQGMPEAQANKVRASLDDLFVDNLRHAMSAEPDSAILVMPDGRRVNVLDVQKQALDDLRKTPDGDSKLRLIQRNATRRVGINLATMAEETALARGLEDEFLRTHVNPSGVQDSLPPTKAAMMAAARGEPLPMLLGVNPKQAAQVMRANVDTLAKELGVPVERAKALLDRMEKEYVPISANARELLRRAEKREHVGKLPDTLYATKGFAEVIDTRLEAIRAFQDTADWLTRLGRLSKLGFTAYNPPAHIHNAQSNIVYQVLRRGVNPVTLVSEMVQTARDWKAYLNGTRPGDYRIRALAKTGFAATSALDDEIAALTFAPPKSVAGAAGKARVKLQQLGQWMESVYKHGDNIPKIHEATRQFDAIERGAREIAIGSSFELDFGGGRGKLYRKLDAERMIGPDGKPVRIDSDAFRDDIAKAAVKPALDIFHDYGDVPMYLAAMKRNGIFALPSWFFSWLYKSTDAPGKKGMVSHMLDYTGDGAFRTDDPRVFARRSAEAAKLAMKRAVMMNAARSMLHEDRESLQPTTGYNPRGMAMSHWQNAIDPRTGKPTGFVDIINHESANPFSGFDLVWRGGTGLLASAVGSFTSQQERMFDKDNVFAQPKTLSGRRLRSLWVKQKTGEWFEPADALAVLGLAGNPILSAFQKLDDSQRGGGDVEGAFGEFTRAMVGGVPYATFKIAQETVESGSGGARRYEIMHPDFDRSNKALWQYERLGDFMTRKLLSLGDNTVNVRDRQEWRQKKAAAYLEALTKALDERRAYLIATGNADKARVDPVLQELIRQSLIVGAIKAGREIEDLDVWKRSVQ